MAPKEQEPLLPDVDEPEWTEEELTLQGEVLAELNLARGNPAGYADALVPLRRNFKGMKLDVPGGDGPIVTKEGVRALDEAIRFLRGLPGPLKEFDRVSEGMSYAARDHVLDLAARTAETEEVEEGIGTDGSSVRDRLGRHGEWVEEDAITEQVMVPNRISAKMIVLQVVSDDGNATRTNRDALFRPEHVTCGFHRGEHPEHGLVSVLTFISDDYEDGAPEPEIIPEKGAPPEDGDPVPLGAFQQAIFDEINLARSDPPAYAEHLEKFKQLYNGNTYMSGREPVETKEGLAGVDNAIAFLLEKLPTPPLERISEGMSLAAEDHIADIGSRGLYGHTGSTGSMPFDRMSRYGKILHRGGECITYGKTTPREIVCSLIVDDGCYSRGHRRNIMTDDTMVIGVCVGPHNSPEGIVAVIDVAKDYMEREGGGSHDIMYTPCEITLEEEMAAMFPEVVTGDDEKENQNVEEEEQIDQDDEGEKIPTTPRSIAIHTYISHCKNKPNSGVLEFLENCGANPLEYDLTGTYVGRSGIDAFLRVLELNNNFHTLLLSGNGLHCDGVQKLVDVLLARESPIEELDLRSNQISFTGGLALLELVEAWPSLVRLDVSSNPIDANVPYNYRLTEEGKRFDWNTPLSVQIQRAVQKNQKNA